MRYIWREDIKLDGVTVSKSKIKLPNYDMYYIEFEMKDGSKRIVRAFCEKNAFPDFESDEHKRLEQKYGKGLDWDFFVERLLGNNSLLAKENRDDYIYMGGNVCKNGHIASRHMEA